MGKWHRGFHGGDWMELTSLPEPCYVNATAPIAGASRRRNGLTCQQVLELTAMVGVVITVEFAPLITTGENYGGPHNTREMVDL